MTEDLIIEMYKKSLQNDNEILLKIEGQIGLLLTVMVQAKIITQDLAEKIMNYDYNNEASSRE